MKKTPAEPTKTFNEVGTVSVPAFQEARKFMDDVLNGRVDPEELKALIDEGVKRKNAQGMGIKLQMSAEGRVVKKRPSLIMPKNI